MTACKASTFYSLYSMAVYCAMFNVQYKEYSVPCSLYSKYHAKCMVQSVVVCCNGLYLGWRLPGRKECQHGRASSAVSFYSTLLADMAGPVVQSPSTQL